MKLQEQIKIQQSPVSNYSEAFKRAIVAEYERGILNKDQIQAKYGIRGNSRVLEWCRKYGNCTILNHVLQGVL